MYREAIRIGMVVKSMAGHDSGKLHVIVREEAGFAYIADGKLRKLDNPKKKNPFHLAKTNTVLDLTDLTDKKLRTVLRTLNDGTDIAEESD
jgi:ribosomal protein L14E/L6E/L27E